MIRRVQLACLLIWLASSAIPGFCQVKVSVKLNTLEYLVGEPVIVIVEATNVGVEGVGYSDCDEVANLAVPGGQRKQPPILHGCFSGEQSGSGCRLYDPPHLAPGKSVSFRHLLKGYRLKSGKYDLHASGKAGVRWDFGWGSNESSISNHKQGDPVEGATFDVSLRFSVTEGTEEELRQRFASYIKEAQDGSGMTQPSREARAAIAEMAPPFLEKTILGFANQPQTVDLAAIGLGQIPTDESRADLVEIYQKSADLRLRSSIVKELAGIASEAELPFFASLLPGYGIALDDDIRRAAALGIGRIGGDRAVAALISALAGASASIRPAIVEAAGNTRSPDAVPFLIAMYVPEDMMNGVCGALATLTHRSWCGGTAPANRQAVWLQWWSDHQFKLDLYGPDQCVDPKELVPIMR